MIEAALQKIEWRDSDAVIIAFGARSAGFSPKLATCRLARMSGQNPTIRKNRSLASIGDREFYIRCIYDVLGLYQPNDR